MFNRKSKSTSKKQQKNIHENYVIEALEPRLLQQVANLSARQ